MDKKKIISQTAEYVRTRLYGESSGHDWWHVYRVWKNALHIAKGETADLFVVQLAALLHDIADYKFHRGDETIGPRVAGEWLKKCGVPTKETMQVTEIIKSMSFKGARVKNSVSTIEGKIVQDADRLDAIGAIGIARTFAYGGFKKRHLHNPDVKYTLHSTPEAYKARDSSTINHFYEKLLLLKDRMNTKTAKKISVGRHKYMQQFLKKFHKEWKGKE